MPHTIGRILEESRRRQLDRRTYLAGCALQGMLANSDEETSVCWKDANVASKWSVPDVAALAVWYADAALAALDKPQEPPHA